MIPSPISSLATNEQLVQRLADLADVIWRQVADPATARQLIGLG